MWDKIKKHLRELWLDRGIITFVLSPFLFLALCHYFQIITKENYIEHITVLFAALFIIIAVFHDRQMEDARRKEINNNAIHSILTEAIQLIKINNSIEESMINEPYLDGPFSILFHPQELFTVTKEAITKLGTDIDIELHGALIRFYTTSQLYIETLNNRNDSVNKHIRLIEKIHQNKNFSDMDKELLEVYKSNIESLTKNAIDLYKSIIEDLEISCKLAEEQTNKEYILDSLLKKAP